MWDLRPVPPQCTRHKTKRIVPDGEDVHGLRAPHAGLRRVGQRGGGGGQLRGQVARGVRVLSLPRRVVMHVRVMGVMVKVVVEMMVVVLVVLLLLGGGWLTIVEQRGGFRLWAAAGGVEALQGGVHVVHQGLQVNVILWERDTREVKSVSTWLTLEI